MQHSHGNYIADITRTAIEVIQYVKTQGKEIRFSSGDSFCSELVDLLTVYSAVDKVGVDSAAIADTVGMTTPSEVADRGYCAFTHKAGIQGI